MDLIYKEFPWEFFFTWKSFVKFFQIFKLKSEFHSHKKVVSPKLENSAHLNIVNFIWANFERKKKTFFDHSLSLHFTYEKIYIRIARNFDLCLFYKGFPCKFFFTWKSFVKFFRIFKLESDFFLILQKKPHFFQNCAHLFPLNFIWANFERKKNLFGSLTFTSLTRTGAVGLGRFRLVHSRWSTAGEKLFFSYFFFLYIFSFFFFFVFFCFFY